MGWAVVGWGGTVCVRGEREEEGGELVNDIRWCCVDSFLRLG